MKLQNKKLFERITLLIIITWFFNYLINHIEDFKQLRLMNPKNIIFLVILCLIYLLLIGMITIFLVKPFKINLSFKEGFGLSIVSSFYNYITPIRGGAIARASYLKKKHNFSIPYFLSTLAGLYVIVFLVNSLIGLVIISLLYFFYKIFNIITFLVFSGLFTFLLFTILFSPKCIERKGIFKNFIKVIKGWNLIKSNKNIILIISFITLIQFFILSFMSYLEFKTFGIEITLMGAMLISIVSSLSLFLSITPGSLGIKEAFIVFSAKIIKVSTTDAIAISLLDRAIFMLILFVLGPIFSYILLNNKPNRDGR